MLLHEYSLSSGGCPNVVKIAKIAKIANVDIIHAIVVSTGDRNPSIEFFRIFGLAIAISETANANLNVYYAGSVIADVLG